MNNSIYISGNDYQYKTIQHQSKIKTLYKIIMIVSLVVFVLGLVCALSLYFTEKNALLNMVSTIINEQGQEITVSVHGDKSIEQLNELIFENINMVFFVLSFIVSFIGYVSTILFAVLYTLKDDSIERITKKIID